MGTAAAKQDGAGRCGTAGGKWLRTLCRSQNPACGHRPSVPSPGQRRQRSWRTKIPLERGQSPRLSLQAWCLAWPGTSSAWPCAFTQARCHRWWHSLTVPTASTTSGHSPRAPRGQTSPTEAAVAVVHQEVSAQGPRRVVVHAAGAVGHVAHHHRLRLREPAGRHSGEGGTPMAPARPASSPPRARVPVPSPARSPRCHVAAPGGPRAAAEPLAVLR